MKGLWSMNWWIALCGLMTAVLAFPETRIEEKKFSTYGEELVQKYRKDYLSAIFSNENTRQDFAKFINSHLTDEVKADLKAVRIFKKVDGAEMPVVSFSPNMDSWLGVLPQWKRVKKFIFNQMEAFVDSRPEILNSARPYLVPPSRNFNKN